MLFEKKVKTLHKNVATSFRSLCKWMQTGFYYPPSHWAQPFDTLISHIHFRHSIYSFPLVFFRLTAVIGINESVHDDEVLFNCDYDIFCKDHDSTTCTKRDGGSVLTAIRRVFPSKRCIDFETGNEIIWIELKDYKPKCL